METSTNNQDIPISREEALKKAGKYALFTAAASVMILVPKKAMADSALAPGFGLGGSGSGPLAPGGISGSSGSRQSPWDEPASKSGSSGLRDSPWK
jgi:hypothetical protein